MKNIGKIWKIIKPARKYFYIVAFLSLVASLESLIIPIISKNVLNNILQVINKHVSTAAGMSILAGQLILIAVVLVIASINGTFNTYYDTLLETRVETILRSHIFRHLASLSIEFFETEQVGKTINKIYRGLTRTNNFLSMLSNWALSQIITFFIAIIILFKISPIISVIAIVTSVIFGYITITMSKTLKPIHKEINKKNDRIMARTVEVFSNIQLVRSFGNEEKETSQYISKNKVVADRYRTRAGRRLKFGLSRNLIQGSFFFLAYGITAYQIIIGRLTPGDIILIGAYIGYIQNPMWNFAWFFDEAIESMRSIDDIAELLDKKSNIVDAENATNFKVKEGNIRFKNVSFSYGNKGGVLKNISFNVKQGETVALVGPSGVGKSTIIKLLCRFYDPTSGSITVDGHNLKTIRQDSYRKSLGIVQQNIVLFNDTLKNNITYGISNVNEKKLKDAIAMANLGELISSLPKGIKTMVGERGIKLSGGEAQRVAIARALLHDPKIIVLDEATSSLDSKNEKLIQAAVSKLIAGRTTLIIAHRLSTIMKADTILVLEGGKIVEQGSHHDLMAKDGIYAELFKIQSGAMLTAEEKK